ncbi:MAG TPA: peptide chain release factor N(5)-glutamine methyltransferase [Candidatus Ruminococcus avistercoris]|nr:peptide chain release factor N(5)-glutamine methyltransferase [Candidatus Ruminococcus avistercoris]
MNTYASALRYGKKYLADRQIENSGGDAWYLMEYVWGIDRNYYFLHSDDIIEQKDEERYRDLLQKRGSHIPLQHLTGTCDFMGLTFQVNDQVLIPRQDTETLVESALSRLKEGDRALDLCTGSGCIILSLEKLAPGIRGLGADISAAALAVAKRNRDSLGLESDFCRSDLFEGIEGVFDMIVSNPPYIASGKIPGLMEEVRGFEPLLALDGGADGLDFYRRIIKDARDFLKPGGWLGLEIGYDQREAVEELLRRQGFIRTETLQDLAGLDRTVWAENPF